MKRYGRIICVLIFSFTTSISIAQDGELNGSWYSTGVVKNALVGNSYLGELQLKQIGNFVTGKFNYYFRDSLFSVDIKGEYDKTFKFLTIKPFKIIQYQASSTKIGIDCLMKGIFIVRISEKKSVLWGSFKGADINYKYTTADIEFNFEKYTDATPINFAGEAKQIKNPDILSETELDAQKIQIQKQFVDRPKNYFKDLLVESKVIQLELVDNGQIDYDSVSIFFNNQLILRKTMLTHKPIQITLTLDDQYPYNEISMFANNVGLIPPNTATLTIIDGDDRRELELNSDFNRTATIKLFRKPKQ